MVLYSYMLCKPLSVYIWLHVMIYYEVQVLCDDNMVDDDIISGCAFE